MSSEKKQKSRYKGAQKAVDDVFLKQASEYGVKVVKYKTGPFDKVKFQDASVIALVRTSHVVQKNLSFTKKTLQKSLQKVFDENMAKWKLKKN